MIMTNFNKKTLLRKRKNSQIAQKQIDIIPFDSIIDTLYQEKHSPQKRKIKGVTNF